MKNSSPATKADLEKYISKKEFRAEIAKLATKEDLKTFERALRMEIRLTTDKVKEEIREEIKQSSSKILDVLDGFIVEMRTSEEERTISAHQIRNHDERISVLEQKVGIATA